MEFFLPKDTGSKDQYNSHSTHEYNIRILPYRPESRNGEGDMKNPVYRDKCTVNNPVYGGSDPDKTPTKGTLEDYAIPQPQSEEGVYEGIY